MAPVTRLAAATDPGAAAAVVADAPQAGSSGATPFGRLVVGETDDYDAPAPAPRLHAALLVITVLPLCVDVPASFAIVATATLAILAGSWRSVKAAPPAETMTQKDAMRFPLIGRCVRRLQLRAVRQQRHEREGVPSLWVASQRHNAAASWWACSCCSSSCPRTW